MPAAGSSFKQQRAVCGIARLDGLQLVDTIEGAECRNLRDRRRRDVEILRQPLDGPHQLLRHHQPADAPAGHAEIFREAVDGDGRLPMGNRGPRGFVIFKPVIDLVGDQPEPAPPAGIGELAEPFAHGHGAGRVIGAGEQQSRRLFAGKAVEVAGVRHPSRRGACLDQHRLRTERLEDVAVAGVAGRWQQHGVAGVEHGEEGEHESGRGARGDDDSLRRDADVIALPVIAGDALAQGGEPERIGIAEPVGLERGAGPLPRRARRRRPRLPHLHMDDVGAFGRADIGLAHHVHDDERIDAAAAGDAPRQRDALLPLTQTDSHLSLALC